MIQVAKPRGQAGLVAIDIDIEECFGDLIAHFEHHNPDESAQSPEQQEEEERVIMLFLRLLCGVLSHDDAIPAGHPHAPHGHHTHRSAAYKELSAQIEKVALRLNSLALPEMVLFLTAAHHRETVRFLLAPQRRWPAGWLV